MNSITGLRFGLGVAALLASPPGMPGGRPSDSDLRITQRLASNFPASLLAEGITSGYVRIALEIDSTGQIVDHLVLGYSRRELVSELLACLSEWEIDPPRQRGEPIGTRAEIVFNFEARGAVVSLTALSATLAATRWAAGEAVSVLCRPADLDRPLAATATAPAVHPGGSLRPPQPAGSAVLDFYVDAEGRPRMAVVVTATHEAFAAAAVASLSRWRFSPPTRAGLPAIVRVRQEFRFTAGQDQSRGTD